MPAGIGGVYVEGIPRCSSHERVAGRLSESGAGERPADNATQPLLAGVPTPHRGDGQRRRDRVVPLQAKDLLDEIRRVEQVRPPRGWRHHQHIRYIDSTADRGQVLDDALGSDVAAGDVARMAGGHSDLRSERHYPDDRCVGFGAGSGQLAQQLGHALRRPLGESGVNATLEPA